MILIKLDCSKIDKARLFKGKKGTYADLVLIEYKDGPKFNNDGFVKQSAEKGVEMPIIGSWRKVVKVAPQKIVPEEGGETVPF